MRNAKEKRPELGGIFLMPRPPISSALHVFSGGLAAVGRGAAIGATVEEGWFTATELEGEESGDSESFPFTSVAGVCGLMRFGFVIGMADLTTVREAIALARAL